MHSLRHDYRTHCRVPLTALLLLGMLLVLPIQLAAASPRVVTTVAPVTSIVENVAGDRARVTGIVPEGVNSHTFRPVPSDARTMARADLIIMNGLYLEIPTLKLAESNKRPDTPVLLLADRTLGEADYVFDFSYPKDQGHPNPHLWPDPVLVMNYARLVRDALTAADPGGRAAYHANAELYLKQLGVLDKAIAAAVATVPPANRRLLTYHDSWPYFAKRYGFTVIGAVQPSSFAEPSPREVARLIDQLTREKVPAVFGSEVFPSPVLAQIARGSGDAVHRQPEGRRPARRSRGPDPLVHRHDAREHPHHRYGAGRLR